MEDIKYLFSSKNNEATVNLKDEKNRIFEIADTGLTVRKVCFSENEKKADRKYVLVFTDPHFIALNDLDIEENYDSVLESYEKRKDSFNQDKINENVRRIMSQAHRFDKVIVTGDIVDFMSHGALNLATDLIYKNRPDAIILEGNHDTTRSAGHRIPDADSQSSRKAVLSKYIKNNLDYLSEKLGGFLLVCMNNCRKRYSKEQKEKLARDIEYARSTGMKIIIFQHEMINTHNEYDRRLPALILNSRWCYDAAFNFCDGKDKIGADDEAVTASVYKLITSNADVISGIVCGHWHNEAYCEINAYYFENGVKIIKPIPQYIIGSCAYGNGCAAVITLD